MIHLYTILLANYGIAAVDGIHDWIALTQVGNVGRERSWLSTYEIVFLKGSIIMACNGDICNCSTCSNFEPPTEEDLKKLREEEEENEVEFESKKVYDEIGELRKRGYVWKAEFIRDNIIKAYESGDSDDIVKVLRYNPLILDENNSFDINTIAKLKTMGITIVTKKAGDNMVVGLRYKEKAYEAVFCNDVNI